MLFACFVFNAILSNCGFLLYEFYMTLPRMISNDGFYHSDHTKHNIRMKWVEDFTSKALWERGIHKCCSRFLSSEQFSRYWISGEFVRYSKRLIVSERVDPPTLIFLYSCKNLTLFFLSLISRDRTTCESESYTD